MKGTGVWNSFELNREKKDVDEEKKDVDVEKKGDKEQK